MTTKIKGSRLYENTIKYWQTKDNQENLRLHHLVWDKTPFMTETFVGSEWYLHCEKYDWCKDNFGQEGSPIFEKAGDWHSGGAIINGWQWIGFSEKEQLDRFLDEFPKEKKA